MGFFDFLKRKKVKLEGGGRIQSKDKVKEAFDKVQRDMTFLQSQIDEHSKTLSEHTGKISQHSELIKNQDSQIRQVLIQISELQMLKESLKIESKGSLRQVQSESKIIDYESKTKESKLRPAVKMIEIAEKNILKNMKRIIKNEILNEIQKNETISISHLKRIICEDKQFCSRASFFNYMKELKDGGLIESKIVDGQKCASVVKEEVRSESKTGKSKAKTD